MTNLSEKEFGNQIKTELDFVSGKVNGLSANKTPWMSKLLNAATDTKNLQQALDEEYEKLKLQELEIRNIYLHIQDQIQQVKKIQYESREMQKFFCIKPVAVDLMTEFSPDLPLSIKEKSTKLSESLKEFAASTSRLSSEAEKAVGLSNSVFVHCKFYRQRLESSMIQLEEKKQSVRMRMGQLEDIHKYLAETLFATNLQDEATALQSNIMLMKAVEFIKSFGT